MRGVMAPTQGGTSRRAEAGSGCRKPDAALLHTHTRTHTHMHTQDQRPRWPTWRKESSSQKAGTFGTGFLEEVALGVDG